MNPKPLTESSSNSLSINKTLAGRYPDPKHARLAGSKTHDNTTTSMHCGCSGVLVTRIQQSYYREVDEAILGVEHSPVT